MNIKVKTFINDETELMKSNIRREREDHIIIQQRKILYM